MSKRPEDEREDEAEGDEEEIGPRLSLAELEELCQVEMPERLRKFFEENESERYEGWRSPELGIASSLPLRFLAGELPIFWEFAGDGYFELPSNKLIAFAVAGQGDGTFFVAADAGNPELPVFFFDYEEGFSECTGSFDEFLQGLTQSSGEDDDDDDEDEGEGGELDELN